MQTDEGLFTYAEGRFQKQNVPDFASHNSVKKNSPKGEQTGEDGEQNATTQAPIALIEADGGGVWVVAPNRAVLLVVGHEVVVNFRPSAQQFSVIGRDGTVLWLRISKTEFIGVDERGLTQSLKVPATADIDVTSILAVRGSDGTWVVGKNKVGLVRKDRPFQLALDLAVADDGDTRTLDSTLLAQDGSLWASETHGSVIYRVPVQSASAESIMLTDAASGLVEQKNGTVWLATRGDGLLQWRQNKVVTHVPDRSDPSARTISSISYSPDDDTVAVALGKYGFYIISPAGDVELYSRSRRDFLIDHVARIQPLGNGRFVLYGQNSVIQVLERGKFSSTVTLSAGSIGAFDTGDGSLWIAGIADFFRYNDGFWTDFKVNDVNRPLVKRVVRLGLGRYLFDAPQVGMVTYQAPKVELRVDAINPKSRTVSFGLEPSDPDLGSNVSLLYQLSSSPGSAVEAQRITLVSSKGQIYVPPSLGDITFLRARALSSNGDIYPLQGRGVDNGLLKLSMPIPQESIVGTALRGTIAAAPWMVGAHITVWAFLILFYPYSPTLQSALFWNRTVRKAFSLWYVDILMFAIPQVRHRLIAPFRDSLLLEARLDLLDVYYDQIHLLGTSGSVRMNAAQLSAYFKGPLIIRGPSGAGKTHLLRFMIKTRCRPAVFVAARSCEKGVVEAIAARLPSQLGDAGLIESLIFHNAMDVYVDGLNEVGPEVRERVRNFLMAFPKANIVVTMQKFRWNVPATYAIYDVQPLHLAKVREYLLEVGENTGTYRRAVDQFIADSSEDGENDHARLDWSPGRNPYDLSIVSKLLTLGVRPNAFDIQEQYFSYVATQFQSESGDAFPMTELARLAYEAKVRDSRAIKDDSLSRAAIDYLLDQKIVIPGIDTPKALIFRHDRVQDYLTAHYLLLRADLQFGYLDDIRFIGVYTLLAEKLNKADADLLLAQLALRATAVRDSTIMYEFVDRLRALNKAPPSMHEALGS